MLYRAYIELKSGRTGHCDVIAASLYEAKCKLHYMGGFDLNDVKLWLPPVGQKVGV